MTLPSAEYPWIVEMLVDGQQFRIDAHRTKELANQHRDVARRAQRLLPTPKSGIRQVVHWRVRRWDPAVKQGKGKPRA